MHMPSSVRTIVEAFWQGHSAGDHEALKRIVAEDATWTVVGKTSPIAKTYQGWDGFFGELLGGHVRFNHAGGQCGVCHCGQFVAHEHPTRRKRQRLDKMRNDRRRISRQERQDMLHELCTD